jgi:hypothetical protein
MAYEASDDVQSVATGSGDGSGDVEKGLYPRTGIPLSTPRQKLLWRMAIVLANVDYFEELSARLLAGAASGEETVALTKTDLTNLRKLVEMGLLILKDQLESGFSSATKEA